MEVCLEKNERGKNGLEDDMDIAMCLANAQVEYRFVSGGSDGGAWAEGKGGVGEGLWSSLGGAEGIP
jgi:hypothetical protein